MEEPFYIQNWFLDNVQECLKPIRKFLELKGRGKKAGGFLYFLIIQEEIELSILLPIGEVDPNKAAAFKNVCGEKAARLLQHKAHLSSWQSREPDSNKWGGAIRIKNGILSVSGLTELGDEAYCLYLAWLLGKVTIEELDAIASISNNPYWPEVGRMYIPTMVKS